MILIGQTVEGELHLAALLETIYQISGVTLFLCAIYYYFHFIKIAKERKLTTTERTVYFVTQAALFLLGSSYLLLILDQSY